MHMIIKEFAPVVNGHLNVPGLIVGRAETAEVWIVTPYGTYEASITNDIPLAQVSWSAGWDYRVAAIRRMK